MKWEDFFAVQDYFVHMNGMYRHQWRVVTLGQGGGNWPTYDSHGDAVRAAKAFFRKIEKDTEKALLG